MFGKLSWEAVPFHEPIVMVTIAMIALGGLALFAAITYFKKWTYLWTEWLTSVDHKKIGVMYIIVAMVMLLRGFADAVMMRTQLAMATEGSPGYLPPEHYDQIFTAHGVIMIIFMAMPFFTGLMNLAVPLQIGARDVAYPFLNSLSFWLLVSGVVLVNLSLGVGEFAKTGWVAYPPLSGLAVQSGRGDGLLHLGATAIRVRYDADRGQLPGHRAEDACPRHETDGHADLHLDLHLGQRPDRGFVPDPDRYPGTADA
jgi:cytochrome o ubiquinol oxidase subunit I